MGLLVHKYGGSSVATPERLLSVADRVVAARRKGSGLVVVVSAMGRTTDALLALASEVSSGEHRRELDMVLTAGERISMALLAMAIRDRGCEALSLTGSQAGIITTTDHNQARIIEVRPSRVREALDAGCIVIVGGFAGVSTAKEVTTLGRGGSDTTAIALAAALSAEHCDIFSDVPGVFTADPRIVPEARMLAELAHGEILEMGLRGARVLAPEAIDYARRHGVTLRARGTFDQGTGTVITHRPSPGAGRAVGVTADAHALPFSGGDSALLDAFESRGLAWHDLQQFDGALHGVLDTRNSPDAARWLERRGGVISHADEATVTVVGEGIAEQPGLWRHVLGALAALGIEPRRVWSNAWGITATVPRDRRDDAVRALHGAVPGLRD